MLKSQLPTKAILTTASEAFATRHNHFFNINGVSTAQFYHAMLLEIDKHNKIKMSTFFFKSSSFRHDCEKFCHDGQLFFYEFAYIPPLIIFIKVQKLFFIKVFELFNLLFCWIFLKDIIKKLNKTFSVFGNTNSF